MNTARDCARDVLKVFDQIDHDAGRAPLEPYELPVATPVGNLLDRLEAVEYRPRPTILAHVMPSVTRPGELSLRLRLTDRTWTAFLEALKEEGFEPGDVVRIEAIR